MAPVCVRVAFIGGGQGEPSRWAEPHGTHRAARRESGTTASIIQTERTRGTTPWAPGACQVVCVWGVFYK